MSSTSSLDELSLAGTESVRIAFRLGIHVDHVSQSLEPQHVEGGKSSWAYVVAGIAVEDVQKELDLFNNTTVPTHPLSSTLEYWKADQSHC